MGGAALYLSPGPHSVCTSHPGNGRRPLSANAAKPERRPDGRSIPRAAVSAESEAHSNAWPRHPHQVLPLLSKETLAAQKGLPLTMVLFWAYESIDRARRAGRMSSLGRNGAAWHY